MPCKIILNVSTVLKGFLQLSLFAQLLAMQVMKHRIATLGRVVHVHTSLHKAQHHPETGPRGHQRTNLLWKHSPTNDE